MRLLRPLQRLPEGAPAQPLALPLDLRRRSRWRLDRGDGEELAWVLDAGATLQPGALLGDAGGTIYRVVAAREPVLRILAATPQRLAQAAYHLGNRHVPVEVGADYLAIQPDAVLQDMLERLGVAVQAVDAPFEPESGAYGGGHRHGHDATFDEDYALAQAAYALRAPAAAAGVRADASEYALPPPEREA